jgi:glutathione S-transferase
MKLYFSPLACSLATRIALYEAGADATFEAVDGKTKLTASGRDFRQIHALGLVPVLQLPNGKLLTENAAILQYVARVHPHAALAPAPGDAEGTAELQQWLCFIGTELHKALFTPLLSDRAAPDAKAYALSLAESRLGYLSQHLSGRKYLLDQFTVADAYLVTILNWTLVTPVDLKPWPVLSEYQARLRDRPSVSRAFREELELYRLEKSGHVAAAPRP